MEATLMRHVWCFEIKKRNRRWPVWMLVGFLSIIFLGGFIGLQQHRSQYVKDYGTRLEKLSSSPGFQGGRELPAFKQSPAAYSRWFYSSLLARAGKTQATKAVSGVGLRIPNGDTSGAMQLSTSTNLTIQAYDLMKAHHVVPMRPDSLLLSDDDLSSVSQESARYLRVNNQFFYEKAWYYVWDLLKQNMIFLLLAVGIIVTSRQWAKEVAHGDAHSRWLTLQGISPSKQILVQFSVIAYTFGQIVLVPLLLILLIVGVWQGFGSLAYPVVAYGNTGLGFGPVFIQLGQYFAQALLVSTGLIVFLTTTNLLFADVLHNSWIVTAVQLILLGVTWITPPILNLPLTYFKLDPIITGALARQADNEQYTPLRGFVVLLGASIILMVILGGIRVANRLVHQRRMITSGTK
jgi:hypothetical protein